MTSHAHQRHTCRQRADSIAAIGPDGADGADPVASRPDIGHDLSAPLVRLEGVRLIQAGSVWQGVGLRLMGAESDTTPVALCELFITAGDGRDVVIGIMDEDEAIAAWRDLGRSSGLPLLLEGRDGGLSAPYPQLGAVALGARHYRRQYAYLQGRRPRFLVRRKTGRASVVRAVVATADLCQGAQL